MLGRKALSFIGVFLILISACSINYTFNGATIDYTKIKTISIHDFPNQASMVYPPLAQMFTEGVKDLYVRQTRLQLERENGDLDLEGEITGYELTPLAVREENALASQTKLTITVRVHYSNRVSPEEDFEQSFSAYREFDSSYALQDVQDELCAEIIEEIADQIYNSTVANW
ncbi:MAG: LPS assembly lipoprotein LptE [Tannerellaceae bacterium]|nr:LPS assembly lipoprotein LptE [Tannerellaceae bacterium]